MRRIGLRTERLVPLKETYSAHGGSESRGHHLDSIDLLMRKQIFKILYVFEESTYNRYNPRDRMKSNARYDLVNPDIDGTKICIYRFC